MKYRRTGANNRRYQKRSALFAKLGGSKRPALTKAWRRFSSTIVVDCQSGTEHNYSFGTFHDLNPAFYSKVVGKLRVSTVDVEYIHAAGVKGEFSAYIGNGHGNEDRYSTMKTAEIGKKITLNLPGVMLSHGISPTMTPNEFKTGRGLVFRTQLFTSHSCTMRFTLHGSFRSVRKVLFYSGDSTCWLEAKLLEGVMTNPAQLAVSTSTALLEFVDRVRR